MVKGEIIAKLYKKKKDKFIGQSLKESATMVRLGSSFREGTNMSHEGTNMSHAALDL